ncbi:amino acid ABC transporter permease [Leptolyngbya sp. FACHB-261]|uniref:amino acid ABC transporter permease n=1 Tax=Leptolyngbya sp. FACHB-261 TaxID=2692806 RepID=UPI001683F430|nr:ABC transporter permease subunit [Leptolyngbya sp. FACHB-261]MBD2100797.1 ABC transporter permease subunit [Leptolyngbya sp. FACHB-261]
MTSLRDHHDQTRPPFWRDERIIRIVLQALFLVAVAVGLSILYRNMVIGLAKAGLDLGFDFLKNSANFGISEGIPYTPADSYFKAFIVGLVNTIWVSVVSIVLSTIMGFALGVARLSSNWLARQLASGLTEIFRNIPVLLIIIYWYQAVFLGLPQVESGFSLFNMAYFSQRGLAYPQPDVILLPTLVLMVLVGWGSWKLLQRWRPDLNERWAGVISLVGALLVAGLVWAFSGRDPFALDVPKMVGFNLQGGGQISAEFLGILLGLVAYTGTYIAEIVRGGFQAVPKGQREAARSIGLSEMNAFRLVIAPIALRSIIPSLNTQYQTLIKNSSLATAVGYPDLFGVGSIIVNQSGKTVEVFTMIMLSYLALNLLVSLGMNWLNERVKLVER